MNEEGVDNWSPATTITMPTISTATTATTTTTTTTNDMFCGSRLGQLESNNYKELSKSSHGGGAPRMRGLCTTIRLVQIL